MTTKVFDNTIGGRTFTSGMHANESNKRKKGKKLSTIVPVLVMLAIVHVVHARIRLTLLYSSSTLVTVL